MIRTVLGDVAPADLGICHAHDHVLIGDGLGARREPDLLIDDVELAVEEVEAFKRAGGRALVDAMPLDCGRDPEGLVEVSRRTGVHIVATTGFHTSGYYETRHWSSRLDAASVADLLCAEVSEGMDRHSYGGPLPERLAARAGLVKVATGHEGIDGRAILLLDLAAECHLRTGVPVITHTEAGALGPEQVDGLTARGVPADAVIVSHVDRLHDPGYHKALADSGAYFVYDSVSRSKYHSPEQVAALIGAACEAGGSERVLLGLDLARRSYRRSYGGRPGLDWLLTSFADVLARAAFSAEEIDGFLRRNPARALSMRAAA